MKKSLLTLIIFLSIVTPAFARTNHYRHQPVQIPPPVQTTPPPSGIQLGAFTGNTSPLGAYQAFFIGDGDSFTADAKGFTEPLVVYWESNLTASQIANGQADSFLKQWATQIPAYGKPVIFDCLDEMNGNWSSYYGNPSAYIAAFRRAKSLMPNVKFAYDPNVAFSGAPISTFESYYPGDAYVDIVGLDGFNFGGQTFAQVYSQSLAAMKSEFPAKPLWILSAGSVDNQTQFVTDAEHSGVRGFIYFDYQQFTLTSAAKQLLSSI